MGLNIAQVRASLYRICGIDKDDMSTDIVDEQLNKSWWEIMNKFKFREKDVVAKFTTVAGTAVYNVPDPFEALRSIAVIDVAGEHHYINRVSSKWYEENHSDSTDAEGFPEYYFREATEITLQPTPDDAYVMVLRYTTTLADLSDTNSQISIPQEWHEIILYGGCWRAMIEIGDLNRSKALKGHQVSLIETCVPVDSKEAGDSRYANLEVVRTPYRL